MAELYAGKLKTFAADRRGLGSQGLFSAVSGRWAVVVLHRRAAARCRWTRHRRCCRDACRTSASKSDHEAKLEALARQDPLTGLANRMVLEERVRYRAVAGCAHTSACSRLLSWTWITSSRSMTQMGHAVGDALLIELAKRLLADGTRRPIPLPAIGGDEFVIVLTEPDSRDAVESACSQRIIDTVRATVRSGRALRAALAAVSASRSIRSTARITRKPIARR
jgi:diguanylate cyclase (GGDEF)-like protein